MEKIKADTPRTMSRDDRRIIFGKLETCWSDAKKTYDDGWTDERVVKDLGVPRAWVSTVRDENFGPIVTIDVEALKTEIEGLKGLLTLQHEKATALAAKLRDAGEASIALRDALAASVKSWKAKDNKAA